jgi:hypothetical protein
MLKGCQPLKSMRHIKVSTKRWQPWGRSMANAIEKKQNLLMILYSYSAFVATVTSSNAVFRNIGIRSEKPKGNPSAPFIFLHLVKTVQLCLHYFSLA